MPTRRHILQGLGAAGLAGLVAPRLAHAGLGGAVFGCQTYKVLHIYLHGALSHRETFWLDDGPSFAPWRKPAELGSETAAASGAERTMLGSAGDYDVYVGEGMHPLVEAGWQHRLRSVAMRTSSPTVHRLASGHALTGVGVGRPGFASVASRMQARWGSDDPYASMVVDAVGSPFLARYAVETEGLDPDCAPVVLPIGNDNFVASLDRGARAHTDELKRFYETRYRDALTHPGHGRVRSDGFDVYETSARRLRDWSGLRERISVVPTFEPTETERWSDTVHGVRVATQLLNSGARHVTVLGGGINVFDSHTVANDDDDNYENHATRHNITLWHICTALVEAIQAGEYDPATTMAVIHSEFGRAKLDANGTEHWGKGYAALLFGGPVVQSGVAGHIDFGADEDGETDVGFTPADLVAATCLAGGVDPVQPGMFSRYQLGLEGHQLDTDEEARLFLGNDLLGTVHTPCDIDDVAG